MSGRKKSALGVALEYSLHIGRAETDKVKTGVVEAGWSGTGRAASTQQIDDDYKALAAKLKTVEQEFAKLSKPAQNEVRTKVEALGPKAAALEKKTVANDETERAEMIRLIKVEADQADKVLQAVATAKLPQPAIHFSHPDELYVNEPVTLAKLAADTKPAGIALTLHDDTGAAVTEIRFAGPGRGTVTLVSAGTAEYKPNQRTVTLDVTLRPRVVTATPATMTWGSALTAADFAPKATGKGGAVVLLTDTTSLGVGEQQVVLQAPGNGDNGGAWGDGEVRVKLTVGRATRSIRWTLPSEAAVGQPITTDLLGVQVIWGFGRGAVESDDPVRVVLPAGRAFTAPGAKQDVKVEAPETATHHAVDRSGTLTVVKGTPVVTWPTPPTAVAGELVQAKHLAIAVQPASLRKDFVFAPLVGTPLAAGLQMLTATFTETADYEAAKATARLVVVANAELAKGLDAAHDGSAFKKPTDALGKARMKEWDDSDEDDPAALATQGKALISKLNTMTKKEITDYMEANKNAPGVSTFVNAHNMKILSFANGLQVRYKPNGSLKNPNPVLCMEVRNDLSKTVSAGQGDIAFKVGATGQPCQKGETGIVRPTGSNAWTQAQRDDFDDGVMAAAHMEVRT